MASEKPEVGKRKRRREGVPSFEDMQSLRETEELYQSNLVRLQTDELLRQLQVRYEAQGDLEKYLHRMREVLSRVPAKTWTTQSRELPRLLQPIEVELQSGPPARLDVVGSYMHRTCSRHDANVDVVLQLPATCLEKRDVELGRYAAKRALYLCSVAEHLRSEAAYAQQSWDYEHADPSRPLLVVQLPSRRWKVRLHVGLSAESVATLRLSRLRPSRPTEDEWSAVAPPSYVASSAILEDACRPLFSLVLHGWYGESGALRFALLLLTQWLLKRGLLHGGGGFSRHTAALLLALCAQERRVHARMSPYQAFRAALATFAEPEFLSAKSILHPPALDSIPSTVQTLRLLPVSSHEADSAFESLSLHGAHPVLVLKDGPAALMNALQHVSLDAFRVLQAEAKATRAALDADPVHGFAYAFLDSVGPPLLRFDVWAEVRAVQPVFHWAEFVARLGQRVSAAFAQRASHIRLLAETSEDGACKCLMGLVLDGERSGSAVIRGPQADQVEEAKAFHALWGSKAQLRRFQDGAIVEAVVWDLKDGEEPAVAVNEHILRYLVARHGGSGLGPVSIVGSQLDRHLLKCETSPMVLGATRLRNCFEALSKRVHQSTLPLPIVALHAVSAEFRYASALGSAPRYPPLDPQDFVDVVLQLESSQAWPDDLEALTRLREAMLLLLAKSLRRQLGPRSVVSSPEFILVSIQEPLQNEEQGCAFRIRLQQPREATLRLRSMDPRIRRLGRQQRKWGHWLPELGPLLLPLAQRMAGYSPTVRLAKRWLARQQLGHSIAGEVVELLVAARALQPPPLALLGGAGLYRWLHFVAHTDFAETPLIVDPSGILDSKDVRALFDEARRSSSSPALFVATPTDPSSRRWTAPEELSASAVAALQTAAKATLLRWDALLAVPSAADLADSWVDAILRPTEGPDVRLLLKPAAYESWTDAAYDRRPDVLETVDALLGHCADVAFDEENPRLVLLRWRTGAFAPRKLADRAPGDLLLRSEQAMVRVPSIPVLLADLGSALSSILESVQVL